MYGIDDPRFNGPLSTPRTNSKSQSITVPHIYGDGRHPGVPGEHYHQV